MPRISSIKNIICVLFIFSAFCGCSLAGKSKSTRTIQKNPSRILFVGNSLTYTNNLPKLVETSAKEKGITIETKMIAFPNYALIDHWNDRSVQKEIETKQYDFVIVQQGPSSKDFGKDILINYGKKYNDLSKENGAQLCYFMVWPSLTYYKTFDGVIKNHREASRLNNAILLPVGEVWKAYFDTTENFDYYSNDGFHPSLKGSQKAAEVIVNYLFNK
ncbi:SGNH/GDSL hydrolase family protein [Winogradskyella sp.]|uniref:SGNH/GDSL hydrolase family protein n=1 Tax=Winogradskyella sp. TaxID=1883156 RepID=UPI0023524D65|nr:SGNH/GDSL hydrolase family protein [Winogradskyella sp.]